MSNESSNSDWTLIAVGISIAIILVIFWYFDELVTLPWAAFRYVESYLWTHVLFFLPDIMTGPHAQLRHELNNLDSWLLLSYENVYNIEYTFLYRTTFLYLIPAFWNAYIIIRKRRPFDAAAKTLNIEEYIEQETKLWRFNRYLIKHNPSNDSLVVQRGKFAAREPILSGLKRTQILSLDRTTNTIKLDYQRSIEVFSKQFRYPLNQIEDIYALPFLVKLTICAAGLRIRDLPEVFTKKERKAAMRRYKFYRFLCNRTVNLPIQWFYKQFDKRRMFYAYADYKLTALIVYKINYNDDVRMQLLGDYAYYLNDEMDLSQVKRLVDHILPQIIESKTFQKYFSSHAYAETLIRRLIFEGRRFGKLPPSHFGAIKVTDRLLWYTINDEGIPGSAFEAAAFKPHFELERRTGVRHAFPVVENILNAQETFGLPKNAEQFDQIEVEMGHPYAKVYPYNPNLEYEQHLKRMSEDSEYRLQQTLLKNVVTE